MKIDDLFESTAGVIRLRDHPRSVRTVQRASESGRVLAILPGVFIRPEDADDPAIRLRAVTAWSTHGAIHGTTALQLHLRQRISWPIMLRSPNRRRPVRWLRVTIGRVPREHQLEYQGIRLVTAAYACVELACDDAGAGVFECLRAGAVSTRDLAQTLQGFACTQGNTARRKVVQRALDNPWSFGEAKLHDLLHRAGISGWVANRPLRVRGQLLYPDLLFDERRLVVEFDGEAVHSGHEQFERDRRRQNLLVSAGYRVLRFTWEAVSLHPDEVVATILATLAEARMS